MAQKSLKNLDSFSRGYIEDVRSKIDFSSTLRATMNSTPITDATSLVITDAPENPPRTETAYIDEIRTPLVGKIISGDGVKGTPRVTAVDTSASSEITITFDQPQTLSASTILTFSDANLGIEQYELTGSSKSRSKEDIRIDTIVPEELLNYSEGLSSSGTTTGIRQFIEAYYQFMNLEEFTYKDTIEFEDVVINNTATFRINDGKNNKFFQRSLVLTAEFFDSQDTPLLVGNSDGTPIEVGNDLALDNTSRLTVGKSYKITVLGNGTATNIATGINNISDQEEISYELGDIFVATDVGTAYSATRGSTPVSVKELLYPTIINDISPDNVTITNSANLPGRLSSSSEVLGRTVIITGLPPRLNNRKIKMKTLVYYYADAAPSYRLNTLEDSLNINEADEEFLDMMQKEIAPALDKTSPVDKRAVYEKIIDFYKVRGSFESIETFFKLLFNEQEVQVSYPWDKTLKPSDGQYDPRSSVTTNYNLTQTIEATNNANNDLFGRSVSVSGDSFAVGAPKDDDGATNRGSAFVFTTSNNGKTFTQEAQINPNDGSASDRFGQCVELDGNTLAISSPGDQTSLGVANTGSIEIWNRSTDVSGNNVWNFNTKLIPTVGGESFVAGNEAISLSGDYLAAGHVGFNADPSDFPEGQVVVYKRTGGSWSVLQNIRAPGGLNTQAFGSNGFGETVVLKGQYLVISFQKFSTSTYTRTGRVIVYKRNLLNGLYEEDAILSPTNDIAEQNFGYALDITNVENGTPRIALTSKDNPYHTVYIFERSEEIDGVAEWSVINSIPSVVSSSVRENTNYGSIVRISGDNLLIGEAGFDTGGVSDVGRVLHYEYDLDTNVWASRLQYNGDLTIANANYGFALDLSDDGKNYFIVGSPGKPDGTGGQKGFVRSYNRPALSGVFKNTAGFLSEKDIKVHDSDFYQKFSYVVKVGRNLSQWKEPFNKLVHPAGFKYFGDILLVLQAVRNVLGDNTRDTTVESFDGVLEKYRDSYSASPAFRKTLSSMPGVQPGYIGIEDVGLLIEAIASSFGIVGVARPNKDAKISIKSILGGGLAEISIPQTGHGYPSVPAVTLGGDGTGATATAVISNTGKVVDVTFTGPHTTFDISGIGADDSRTAGTYTGVTTGGSRSSGSGASGQVTIVVTDGGSAATNGVISSITSTTAGSGYEVGEIITIPDSALGGGGGAAISFTVASVGSGYTPTGTTISIQTVAQESADDSLTGDNAIVAGKIGKLNSTSLGLFLVGLNNKSYTSTPTITISPPDARGSNGKPLATNIQATATLTRNSTTGKITGFTITNPGNGYLSDATITVKSVNEKRVPDYIHKKVLPINHDENLNGVYPQNNYFARKNRLESSEIINHEITVDRNTNNDANVFYIDTIENPSLILSRGKTYRFKQKDISNLTHLIKFSKTPDGTHGGGLEYITGVVYSDNPGSSDNAYTQITIASDAPSELYYYCNNHSGMGSSLKIFGDGVTEDTAFLRPKKFQGGFLLKDFSDITIKDITKSKNNNGTLINKLNIQTSLTKDT
jgi:hypothetical protein